MEGRQAGPCPPTRSAGGWCKHTAGSGISAAGPNCSQRPGSSSAPPAPRRRAAQRSARTPWRAAPPGWSAPPPPRTPRTAPSAAAPPGSRCPTGCGLAGRQAAGGRGEARAGHQAGLRHSSPLGRAAATAGSSGGGQRPAHRRPAGEAAPARLDPGRPAIATGRRAACQKRPAAARRRQRHSRPAAATGMLARPGRAAAAAAAGGTASAPGPQQVHDHDVELALLALVVHLGHAVHLANGAAARGRVGEPGQGQ